MTLTHPRKCVYTYECPFISLIALNFLKLPVPLCFDICLCLSISLWPRHTHFPITWYAAFLCFRYKGSWEQNLTYWSEVDVRVPREQWMWGQLQCGSWGWLQNGFQGPLQHGDHCSTPVSSVSTCPAQAATETGIRARKAVASSWRKGFNQELFLPFPLFWSFFVPALSVITS